MQKFILFAARDGETIVRTTVSPDMKTAEGWAFETVRSYFEINMEFIEDFIDIQSETDGMILMEFEKLDQFVL